MVYRYLCLSSSSKHQRSPILPLTDGEPCPKEKPHYFHRILTNTKTNMLRHVYVFWYLNMFKYDTLNIESFR